MWKLGDLRWLSAAPRSNTEIEDGTDSSDGEDTGDDIQISNNVGSIDQFFEESSSDDDEFE